MAAQPLRIAVFAEGSTTGLPADDFLRLWSVDLPAVFGLRRAPAVYPISKLSLLAMDSNNPPMAGSGEGLDAYMARVMKRAPFDAAVIAWDLFPKWAGVHDTACRWRETLRLYELLGSSRELPPAWRDWAAAKFVELSARSTPNARSVPPQLVPFATLALCMEPDFEGLLVGSEAGVKRALGLRGLRVAAWPGSWKTGQRREPRSRLLQPALVAAQAIRPKVAAAFAVRGDWHTAPHAWGRHLLQRLAIDPRARAVLYAHPIARRLREVL